LGNTFIPINNGLSVENADKIVVISGGRVVQEGVHKELINQDGLYKQLVKRQMLSKYILKCSKLISISGGDTATPPPKQHPRPPSSSESTQILL
jgi:hypothetical protein